MHIAGIRNVHKQCPKEVIHFLMELFKYNDNQMNKVGGAQSQLTIITTVGCEWGHSSVVEQWTAVPEVPGSNPGAPLATIFFLLQYSDCYLVSGLIDALAESITPKVAVALPAG